MTADELAQWMVEQLNEHPRLYQIKVVSYARPSNPELFKRNANGNWALQPEVLRAFRKLTPDDETVWVRSDQMWRHRLPRDKPGRMQS